MSVLCSVLQDRHIDMVVSGINRGDNAGLHVIYSGTVGAAREGACKVCLHPPSVASLQWLRHMYLKSLYNSSPHQETILTIGSNVLQHL